MEPVEILKKARELLTDPNKWAKESRALNADGGLVWPTNPAAVCWCAEGAIIKFSEAKEDFIGEDSQSEGIVALELMEEQIPEDFMEGKFATLPEYNDADDRTHDEILALFDKTINANGG